MSMGTAHAGPLRFIPMALILLLLVQFQALTSDVLTYAVRGNKGTVPPKPSALYLSTPLFLISFLVRYEGS